jgi:hypothetical protein
MATNIYADIEEAYRKLPLKTIEEVEDLECLLDAANQKNREYFVS